MDTPGSLNKIRIPGLVDLRGNEAAKELAREGAEMPMHGPEPFCGVVNEFMSTMLKMKRNS